MTQTKHKGLPKYVVPAQKCHLLVVKHTNYSGPAFDHDVVTNGRCAEYSEPHRSGGVGVTRRQRRFNVFLIAAAVDQPTYTHSFLQYIHHTDCSTRWIWTPL